MRNIFLMMEPTSNKRTLDSFFKPAAKKIRSDPLSNATVGQPQPVESNPPQPFTLFSEHTTYPFPIPHFPTTVTSRLTSLTSKHGKVINDQPDLDLLYFQPYITKGLEREIFHFLRSQLPFYRVEYDIKRFGVETHIRTPRYTTVFGIDSTSHFSPTGLIQPSSTFPASQRPKYPRYAPRPLPACLNDLRLSTEAATGCTFNFCLVNYYASGADSISYHSDDELFLGPLPAIASFSLGAKRDFLMKHKPIPEAESNGKGKTENGKEKEKETKPLKLPLESGDMVLMRGATQANWLHSIPKRSGKNAEDGGRINITFRKAVVPAGTDNYYHYNVGTGPVFKWDETAREMRVWSSKR